MYISIRHRVARYLTDRPGSVVYRDDLVNDTGLTAKQVTSSIRALQQRSPLGAEVQTVVTGNAWRYVPLPTAPVTQSTSPSPSLPSSSDVAPVTYGLNGDGPPIRRRRSDGSKPLTWRLRDYLVSRPHVTVHCDELARELNVTEYQVQIGINNMRRGHLDIRPHIEIITQGRSWRYTPSSTLNVESVTTTRDVGASPESTFDASDESPRLFEEVGTTADGDIIIRDDDGVLYHTTKM